MRITVTSHKGGVGKSVTTIHLAAYLTMTFGEDSTVVVDTDPNGSVLGWARRGRLPFPVVTPEEAGRVLEDYDHAVIDTQGRPRGTALERIVDGCDLLVVPTTPDADSLDALMMMASDLDELGGRAEYRVLLTVMPPWPVQRGPRARKALQRNEIPTFEGEIKRREVFTKASLRGVPVYEVKDRRAQEGWEDYRQVGREVIGG